MKQKWTRKILKITEWPVSTAHRKSHFKTFYIKSLMQTSIRNPRNSIDRYWQSCQWLALLVERFLKYIHGFFLGRFLAFLVNGLTPKVRVFDHCWFAFYEFALSWASAFLMQKVLGLTNFSRLEGFWTLVLLSSHNPVVAYLEWVKYILGLEAVSSGWQSSSQIFESFFDFYLVKAQNCTSVASIL